MAGKRRKILAVLLCGLVLFLNVGLDFAHGQSHRFSQNSERTPDSQGKGQFHDYFCLACCLVITHVAPQPISATFRPDEHGFPCASEDSVAPRIVLSPSYQLRAPPASLS